MNLILAWWWESKEFWELYIKLFLNSIKITSPHIVFLCDILKDNDFFERIEKKWKSYDPNIKVSFIFPKNYNDKISDTQIDIIKKSNAVFINWWDTRNYNNFYKNNEIIEILKNKLKNNITIAGISAWALILPTKICVWWNYLNHNNQKFELCSTIANNKYINNNIDAIWDEWLWIIKDIAIDVHATQWGRLPRLLETMNKFKLTKWIWIDENCIIDITWKDWTVYWFWRAYTFTKLQNWNFEIKIYFPWETITNFFELNI